MLVIFCKLWMRNAVVPLVLSSQLVEFIKKLMTSLIEAWVAFYKAKLWEALSNEIGVRVALGARARQVVRLVLARSIRMVAIGAIVGVATYLAAATALERFVFGVSARDPIAIAAVLALFGLSAVLAWHDRAGRHGCEAVRAAVDERPDDPVETDHDPRLAEEQHAERFVPEFVGRGHDVPAVSELRGGVGEEHGGIVPTRRRRCVSCA